MHDNKVILVDCDGVCMNWEYAFHVWMSTLGYELNGYNEDEYYMHPKYINLDEEKSNQLIDMFNRSAAMGFLPPLRDAMYYIDLLHRKHGYVFHMITSMSSDENAQRLRKMNAEKLFGETAFERFIFLDRHENKSKALSEYFNSGHIWIEDLPENAAAGFHCGLDCLLMEHRHNMDCDIFPRVKNWQEIYKYIIGE